MSSPASKKTVVQYGLSEVFSAPSPEVDIVFVHGLNGHPHNTWATPHSFWPQDLLPQALEEQRCRILTYGYDANVTAFTDGTSKDKIHNHAEHLASRLVANRSLKKALGRPIIFICHSLGGLVVKRCLIHCKNVRHAHTERLRSIYVSTYGILFLGTPHNGSDLAKWGTLLQHICSAVLPKKFFDTSPQLIEALKSNNETLQNINRLFIPIIDRFHVYMFHESKPMDLKGTRSLVVDEDSAAPDIDGVERMGIERDHSHMCKFEDENAPGYDVVAEAVQRYADAAPRLIKQRWEEEKRIREYERQGAAREMLNDSIYQMTFEQQEPQSGQTQPISLGAHTPKSRSPPRSLPPGQEVEDYEVEEVDDLVTEAHSSTPSMKLIEPASPVDNPDVPLLIAPLGFRPNSIFYGFESELEQLDVKLHNKKRQAIGSCSVLVTGTAGCGKTHLVRQYVWQAKRLNSYPEGIYWVDARSRENAYRSFWDIGQAAALLGANKPRNQDWDAASKYVDTVRKWLETREGWLLVFDGLAFDNEDEIADFLHLVPDKKGNCIIITSVDKTLRGRQRLLNPTSVKVQPLSPQDGSALLFKSLGINRPSQAQITKAEELVKHYEGLPLAIHAAAHALIAKGRALETYTPGLTEKRLAEPYLEILQALRENSHVEAVNLITLLSFFNHTIPVALITLGRRALNDFGIDIRSTDRKDSNKCELDNTIAVLIKYGLLTRVLQPYHLTEQSLRTEISFTTAADSSSVQTGDSNGSPVELRTRRDSGLTTRDLQENIKPGAQTPSSNGHATETVYAIIEGKSQTTNTAFPLTIDARPESSLDSFSAKSIRYNIDILRVHTVIQNVFRDELRLRDRERYYWWLGVAVRLFALSYTVADTRIRASPRQGLVRDYREFETQAAALRSHFPRPEKAPKDLHKVRTELRVVLKKIRREIQIRSPSHSIESLRHRVQVSIFERYSSTSSDAPDTPTDASGAESWSLSDSLVLESPTNIEGPPLPEAMESSDSWDEKGYDTDYHSSAVTTRRSSRSEATDTDMPTDRDPDATRRASFLQAIFKGRPVPSKKQKDLGEWKPSPAAPSLVHPDVRAVPSRTSSGAHSLDERSARLISAESDAEAALAAVHRMSPPASRGGRIRSPSRPLAYEPSELGRRPLEDRNPNTQLSPLAAEFKSSTPSSTRHHSRTSSYSPRMAQVAMANAAASSNKELPPLPPLPPLPAEESITVTRRTPLSVQQSTFYGSPPSIAVNEQVRYLPTGYTSQPMTRDNSAESAHSLLSAPATAPAGLGLGSGLPTATERRLPPSSIDIIAANAVEFGRMGEWSDTNVASPLTPSVPGLNIPGSIDAVQVQFGQMNPVRFEEARARAEEYASVNARRGSREKEKENR